MNRRRLTTALGGILLPAALAVGSPSPVAAAPGVLVLRPR